MSSGILIVTIIVVVVLLASAVVLGRPALRSRRLREKFGPEYDRTVAESEDRRAAERELAERERRHAELELRELPQERKDYFTDAWSTVQERFVDQPEEAVSAADTLVTTLMGERGYPTGSYDQQAADLSVEHATTLGHYRDAHAIALKQADGQADTEDLRTALVHYRTLFLDLMNGHTEHEPTAKAEHEPVTPADRDTIAHETVSVHDDVADPGADDTAAQRKTAEYENTGKNHATAENGVAPKKDTVV